MLTNLNLNFKEWTKDTFFQRGYANGQQAQEKMLNITNHYRHANKIHNMLPLYVTRMATTKRNKETSISKDMEKLKPLYIAGRNVKWCSRCGKQFCSSSKS